jgi:hypothetical protein
MGYMFYYASDFVKNVTVWNVCNVGPSYFQGMFTGSGQPETDLVPDANGECIACPAGTTSGSGKYVEGQNPCSQPCFDNSSFRTALALWFTNSTLATITYGDITDW